MFVPGEEVERMLEATAASVLTCRNPNCDATFTLREGFDFAQDFDIPAMVVMCPHCANIYEVEITPGAVTLGAVQNNKYDDQHWAGIRAVRTFWQNQASSDAGKALWEKYRRWQRHRKIAKS